MGQSERLQGRRDGGLISGRVGAPQCLDRLRRAYEAAEGRQQLGEVEAAYELASAGERGLRVTRNRRSHW